VRSSVWQGPGTPGKCRDSQGAGGQLCHSLNSPYFQDLSLQNVTGEESRRKHPRSSLSLPEISSVSFFMPSSVAMVTAAVRAEFHSIPSSMLSSDSAIWVMLPAREATSAPSAAPGVPALNPCFAFHPPHPSQAVFHSRGQVVCAWLLSTKSAKSKYCCFSLEL